MKRGLCLCICVITLLSSMPVTNATAFTDIDRNAYYYEALLWAVEENIIEGISATEFAPHAPCTRGQAVTMLWRASGCPEPLWKDHSFTDVSEDAYYYQPMLWAVRKRATNGVSATEFAPQASCSRGELVTLMWRSLGDAVRRPDLPFQDVKKGTYYYEAVMWAVSDEITRGVSSTHFAPADPCTRAQMVTFLYRCHINVGFAVEI